MTLQEIQKSLKVPKSNTNSFGKYKYRSCEDILEAVKPLLGDSVLTLSDEIVNIGDRYYVKATARFLTIDNSTHKRICAISGYLKGETALTEMPSCTCDFKGTDNSVNMVTAYARESLDKKGMDDSQITGTASSYARKYALNGLFLIDDTKDADTDEHSIETNEETTVQMDEEFTRKIEERV